MNELLEELQKEQEHIPDGVWDTVKEYNTEENVKKRESSWFSRFIKPKEENNDEKK